MFYWSLIFSSNQKTSEVLRYHFRLKETTSCHKKLILRIFINFPHLKSKMDFLKAEIARKKKQLEESEVMVCNICDNSLTVAYFTKTKQKFHMLRQLVGEQPQVAFVFTSSSRPYRGNALICN